MQLSRGRASFPARYKIPLCAVFLLLFLTIRSAGCKIPKLNVIFYKVSDLSIKEGDYIMLGDKSMWIASSAKVLLSVQLCRGTCRGISIDLDRIQEPRTAPAAKLPLPITKGWNAEKALALVKVLQNKVLPFGSWYCNGDHYMRYIMYAQTYTSRWKPSCPLQRDLTNVSVNEINDKEFFLEYSSYRRPTRLYVERLDYIDPYPLRSPSDRHRHPKRHRSWQMKPTEMGVPINSPSSSPLTVEIE